MRIGGTPLGWSVAMVAAVSLGAAADQPAAIRYQSSQLRCAAFAETIRTRIRGESDGAVVTDKAGRDGILIVRARDTTGGLSIEAWYDSLAVWRLTDTGRESPDVEGLIGGRYRGRLSPTGGYLGRTVPFIPEEVAEVADLAPAVNEFFPLVPPVPLAVGREWAGGDSLDLKIKRLADEVIGGEVVRRFEWRGTRRVARESAVAESLAVTVDQLIKERGELQWSGREGPLRWSRHLVINARIPPRGGVRRSVTSVIEQDIEVIRRVELEPCRQ
jgi:hypothetical protein